MKTVLLVHGDSDGVVSGALAYKFFTIKHKNQPLEVFFSHPAGLHVDLKEFATPGDTIFIADIALSELHLEELMKLFKKYNDKGELIYVDHHPEPLGVSVKEIPGTVVYDMDCSSSELTYRFFEEQLGFEYSRVAVYGAIGDYLDETPWVKEVLEKWDKRSVYFEAGVLSQGLEASRKMYDFKRHVVKHLSENKLPSSLSELLVRALIESVKEEELRIWVKQNKQSMENIGYVIEPPGSLGRAANYVKTYTGKPVGLAASKHKNYYVMSLRSSRNIDLNRILREIAPKYHGTGGGHPFAAGARIPINFFRDFLITLDKVVSNSTRG